MSAVNVQDEAGPRNGPMTVAVSRNLLFDRKRKRADGGEETILKPGVAYHFVKALLRASEIFRENFPDDEMPFSVVLTTNDLTQKEILRASLNHHGLSKIAVIEDDISKLNPKSFYLSEDAGQAEAAISAGYAAAIMFPDHEPDQRSEEEELHVVFDADGVLFSDESETVFKKDGLEAYIKNEDDNEDNPFREGPLKCFMEALSNMQKKFIAKRMDKPCPVETYMVTSRDPVISGTRALRTLKKWDLELTQAHFLSGRAKGPLLKMIHPHVFFDDQMRHIDGARAVGITSALVPYGIGYKTCKGAIKNPNKN